MTNVNFKLDKKTKKAMEEICEELGLTMSGAFSIFARKVAREKRIPFEVSIDPFYEESNINHLKRGIKALNNNEGHEHEIIED